jgi:hypothetical protein
LTQPASGFRIGAVSEIIDGVRHWTAPNPSIGNTPVSSYWLDASGVLIDPLLSPEHGIEWLAWRPVQPSAVVLSNRHHYRDSGSISGRFGCTVHVPALGLHEFGDDRPVVAYEPGDSLPGGLLAVRIGVLSPDDGGLYLEAAGSLWLADTIVRSPTDPDSRIGWVPDALMDDPPETKRKLLGVFERILAEYAFENLMLAHGLPLIGNGREELMRFVHMGGRTAAGAF